MPKGVDQSDLLSPCNPMRFRGINILLVRKI